MLAGHGMVEGAHAVAFASDATVMGGAMGAEGCKVILAAYARALADDVPIVGLWHSGGAGWPKESFPFTRSARCSTS